jgi:hypothetical protein
VVEPTAKKAAALAMVEEKKISKTRACRVLGLNRSTFTYQKSLKKDQPLIDRM